VATPVFVSTSALADQAGLSSGSAAELPKMPTPLSSDAELIPHFAMWTKPLRSRAMWTWEPVRPVFCSAPIAGSGDSSAITSRL
jgi:hypothetical protein